MHMPRTINEGFKDFLSKLTPSSSESDAAKKHRASIESCLKSNFSVLRFFQTGSFGNGTSISGYSDVDYFASLNQKPSTDSDTALSKVRNALDKRFPLTGVRVNCPAVKVPLGTLDKGTTEVVPADLVLSSASSHSVYDIPNCSGRWMRSSPETHNSYVREVDQKLGNKVRPLVRFIKAWKYYQNVPISSFYLELRVAKYAESQSTIIYDWDVKDIFSLLQDKQLAAIKDPKNVSGYIAPCATQSQLETAKLKLATAASRAGKARDAEIKGNTKDAFYWWNLLYTEKFPNYYR
jgi:hypothetical protein